MKKSGKKQCSCIRMYVFVGVHAYVHLPLVSEFAAGLRLWICIINFWITFLGSGALMLGGHHCLYCAVYLFSYIYVSLSCPSISGSLSLGPFPAPSRSVHFRLPLALPIFPDTSQFETVRTVSLFSPLHAHTIDLSLPFSSTRHAPIRGRETF